MLRLIRQKRGWQTWDVTTAAAALPRSKVRAFLSLVMIEHSVFALPFAYIAALTAMWQQTRSVHWVQLAADHGRDGVGAHRRDVGEPDPRPRFDALNPRTARRELVTGELSVRSAWTGTVVALVVFLGSAAALSWRASRSRRSRSRCSSSTPTASGSPTSRRCCSRSRSSSRRSARGSR